MACTISPRPMIERGLGAHFNPALLQVFQRCADRFNKIFCAVRD